MPDPEQPTEPTSDHDERAHADGTCPVAWCPFCLAVSAVKPISPEVVGHLLKAGTEFFLAFRSAIETRADDLEGVAPAAPVRLEKIDVG
jgi:hypothetical protein